jgi:O-acetyl-ADP-ribose deacetylase (regulator of RNase III)
MSTPQKKKKKNIKYCLLVIGGGGIIIILLWLLKNNIMKESSEPPPSSEESDGSDNFADIKKYGAIKVTEEYQKYKYNSSMVISAAGISEKEFLKNVKGGESKFLPAGSALLTDTLEGSELDKKGIKYIIHAAPKPRSSFSEDKEFIDCVVKSVQNSIILADQLANNSDEGMKELAIPLVGGGIYRGDCDPQKLAQAIIIGAVHQLEKCQHLKKINFIDWGGEYKYFAKSFETKLQSLFSVGNIDRYYQTLKLKNSSDDKYVICKEGDIRNKEGFHHASIIVNAANTEVKFGAGISGKISEQVGDKNKIDQVAEGLIRKFNNSVRQTFLEKGLIKIELYEEIDKKGEENNN